MTEEKECVKVKVLDTESFSLLQIACQYFFTPTCRRPPIPEYWLLQWRNKSQANRNLHGLDVHASITMFLFTKSLIPGKHTFS